jgi:hypothetical protein
MKNVFLFLVGAIIVIVLNGLYFEYCVSREMPLFLSTVATIVILLVDVLAMVYAVKLLIKILKI